jgi:portal protein
MDTQRFLNAAGKILTGDFGAVVKSSAYNPVDVYPSTYRSTPDGTPWFMEMNGGSVFHFKYSGHTSSLKAYKDCAPLNAIINRKAQAYINGKTWVLNTTGKAKGKESTSEAATKIKNLFAKPNPLQSWKQFEAQGYIYEQIFGFNMVLPIKPVGYKDNIDATSLWNIPPSMIDIEETNKLFYQTDMKGIVKSIVLNYKGQRVPIKVEDLHFFKDFTPSFDSLIIPETRVCALALPINNIIGAYESRNVLINYRGAVGIFSQDPGNGTYGTLPITQEEKDKLQQDFRRYGLKYNQWQFIITSAALKWQQIGVATKDLMLFEEIEDDVMRICDSYNYPYRLLSSNKSNSLGGSDIREFKALLYQDATIPEAESNYEQWNNFFGTPAYNIIIDKDYSHIAVLQQDQLQAAQARKARNDALLIEYQNDLITMNRWLELNGEDPRPDGDRYYSEIKRAQNGTEGQQTETQTTQANA